jgi:chromosome partitioning protein
MYTLVLASQKGGSGKTTLSGHLAVQAVLAGAGPVAVIDTDPQGSLCHWWNARKSESPHFVKTGLPDLEQAIAELRESGFKLVVIDTPPAITSSITQVIAHADLVIIPARPSPHDLRAVGATVDLAERHNKPVVFVVNAATARARITGEAAVALSQHGTVAPIMLKNRVDFAASMVDGRTVSEVVPNGPSAGEIRDLWSYLQDRLFRIRRDVSIMPDFKPSHLSVSPLSALDDTATAEALSGEEAIEPENAGPETMPTEPAHGAVLPEKRAAFDRRVSQATQFGSVERRNYSFGRRASDQILLGQGQSK